MSSTEPNPTEATPPPAGAAVTSGTRTYLDWGAQGKGGNFRYLVGAILILIIWFGGQTVMQVVTAPLLGITIQPGGEIISPNPVAYLIFNLAAFIPFFIATPLIVKVLLKRPGMTVATPFTRVNWGLIGKGAGFWLLATLVPMVPLVIARWGDYRINADFGALAVTAVVVAVFLIWQTSAEELFFRGYLMQWFGKGRWRNPVFLGIVSGLLFAAPHLGNPEVRDAAGVEFVFGVLAYFSAGFGWAFVSVRSGTIELAIGAHFINNLVNILFVTVETSALGPTSLLIDGAPSITEAGITAVVSTALFIAFVWKTRGSGVPRPFPAAQDAQPVPSA